MAAPRNPVMRKVYDDHLRMYEDLSSPLYDKGGLRNRGSSWHCAFWNGFDGVPNLLFSKGSSGYAAYCAGRDAYKFGLKARGEKK